MKPVPREKALPAVPKKETIPPAKGILPLHCPHELKTDFSLLSSLFVEKDVCMSPQYFFCLLFVTGSFFLCWFQVLGWKYVSCFKKMCVLSLNYT